MKINPVRFSNNGAYGVSTGYLLSRNEFPRRGTGLPMSVLSYFILDACLCSNKQKRWGDGEVLGGAERRETRIRIYCMKKNKRTIFNERKAKNQREITGFFLGSDRCFSTSSYSV